MSANDPAGPLLAAAILGARSSPALAAAFAPREVAVWNIEPSRAPGYPGETGYPFLEIPSIEVYLDERIENGVCIVDDGEATISASAFSRIREDGSGGAPEAMAIAGAFAGVMRALAFAPGSGWRVTLCESVAMRHYPEPDALTAHSSVTARFQIEPSED